MSNSVVRMEEENTRLPISLWSLDLRRTTLLEERIEGYKSVGEVLQQCVLAFAAHLARHEIKGRQPLVGTQVPIEVRIMSFEVGVVLKATWQTKSVGNIK